jgi:hypothetical protein
VISIIELSVFATGWPSFENGNTRHGQWRNAHFYQLANSIARPPALASVSRTPGRHGDLRGFGLTTDAGQGDRRHHAPDERKGQKT